MVKFGISTKRLQIDKANATVTLVVALATFITISSLMGIRTLLIKRSYQSRVVAAKQEANKQLDANKKAVDTLKVAYAEYVERPTNIIGGLTDGKGDKDGDNAKITLDALPSKYDFPALATSLEKILVQKNFRINGIKGNDDEVAQQENKTSPSPEPVEMPFTVSVIGGYDAMIDLMGLLERSIRPVRVQSLTFTASDTEIQLDLEATSYYLPEKSLNISTKAVQ